MVKCSKSQIRRLKTSLRWKIPATQRQRIQMVLLRHRTEGSSPRGHRSTRSARGCCSPYGRSRSRIEHRHILDSLRFRVHLGRHFGVDPAHVEAQVIGDHGTSQVFLWSSARIGGVPVMALLEERGEKLDDVRTQLENDVRYANIAIIEGHDASQFGIGIVSARIAEIVLRDEGAVIPIGSYQRAFGGTLSLPSVVGRGGVVTVLQPDLSVDERSGLESSAEGLRNAQARVRK
jgi:malate/lactate dehydrogenase